MCIRNLIQNPFIYIQDIERKQNLMSNKGHTCWELTVQFKKIHKNLLLLESRNEALMDRLFHDITQYCVWQGIKKVQVALFLSAKH